MGIGACVSEPRSILNPSNLNHFSTFSIQPTPNKNPVHKHLLPSHLILSTGIHPIRRLSLGAAAIIRLQPCRQLALLLAILRLGSVCGSRQLGHFGTYRAHSDPIADPTARAAAAVHRSDRLHPENRKAARGERDTEPISRPAGHRAA